MSESLTKEQRKKLKKKAAQKRRKSEDARQKEDQLNNDEEESILDKTSVENRECTSASDAEKEDENFESELCWCIEQLQLGIKNKKPSKDQVEKATKMIRLLRSEKTAKARKRQIMHTTFGDYRKKMAAEARQHDSQVRQETKMVAVTNEKAKASLFLKTKSEAVSMSTGARGIEDEAWHFTKSENNFEFSFPEPEGKKS